MYEKKILRSNLKKVNNKEFNLSIKNVKFLSKLIEMKKICTYISLDSEPNINSFLNSSLEIQTTFIENNELNVCLLQEPFVINAFRKSPTLSMILSLFDYNDKKFFDQNENLKQIYFFLENFETKDSELENLSERLKWREEYSWVVNHKLTSLFENKQVVSYFNEWTFDKQETFNFPIYLKNKEIIKL